MTSEIVTYPRWFCITIIRSHSLRLMERSDGIDEGRDELQTLELLIKIHFTHVTYLSFYY